MNISSGIAGAALDRAYTSHRRREGELYNGFLAEIKQNELEPIKKNSKWILSKSEVHLISEPEVPDLLEIFQKTLAKRIAYQAVERATWKIVTTGNSRFCAAEIGACSELELKIGLDLQTQFKACLEANPDAPPQGHLQQHVEELTGENVVAALKTAEVYTTLLSQIQPKDLIESLQC